MLAPSLPNSAAVVDSVGALARTGAADVTRSLAIEEQSYLLLPVLVAFSVSLACLRVLASTNVPFWWKSGYFNGLILDKPLLHLRSLVVIELVSGPKYWAACGTGYGARWRVSEVACCPTILIRNVSPGSEVNN
jgi:hypothetical protein